MIFFLNAYKSSAEYISLGIQLTIILVIAFLLDYPDDKSDLKNLLIVEIFYLTT